MLSPRTDVAGRAVAVKRKVDGHHQGALVRGETEYRLQKADRGHQHPAHHPWSSHGSHGLKKGEVQEQAKAEVYSAGKYTGRRPDFPLLHIHGRHLKAGACRCGLLETPFTRRQHQGSRPLRSVRHFRPPVPRHSVTRKAPWGARHARYDYPIRGCSGTARGSSRVHPSSGRRPSACRNGWLWSRSC